MLCHQYNCIFVHIPKTAGQSIEHVFLDLAGLTWEKRAPLLLRANKNIKKGPPRLAHLKASEYLTCGYVPQEQFDTYFKFSFVRNPWDRIVSVYKYWRLARMVDFKTFLFKYLPPSGWSNHYVHIMPQYNFLFDSGGKLLVDFIGRYENLQEDFSSVCRKIGINEPVLPHVNRSTDRAMLEGLTQVLPHSGQLASIKNQIRNLRNHYKEYYDDESKKFVAELYQKDIEAFGYEFALPGRQNCS